MFKLYRNIFVLFLLSILATFVLAEQTVKEVNIPVGFGNSVPANTTVFKTVNVVMPDRISSLVYGTLFLTGDYAANTSLISIINISGAVKNCTPTIITPNSVQYNYHTEIDCSSAFPSGFTGGPVSFGFRSNKAVTNIFGGLQLTYYNNPPGSLTLSGTEYSPGDLATMFVQLKDTHGNPVQNGSCFLDVWYPLTNGTHPYTIQDAPMIQALGDDGLYYYDMVAPSGLGVYMLSAKCAFSYNWQWIYPVDELIYGSIRTIITGTFTGGGISLNSPTDTLYEKEAGSLVSANYTFNISQYGVLTNITNINLYYAGEGQGTNTLTFAYWNGTAFVNLPNTLTFQGTAGGAPSGTDQYQTNSVPLAANRNNIITIRLSWSGNNQQMWTDWLTLAILTSYGTVQEVKGSSEMHVTNLANATLNAVNSGINVTNIAAGVWNYTMRNLTYFNYISQAGYVWNYTPDRFLTYERDTTNYTLVQQAVWNYTNRNLTYYPPQVDMTNYTFIDYIVKQALDLYQGVKMTLGS